MSETTTTTEVTEKDRGVSIIGSSNLAAETMQKESEVIDLTTERSDEEMAELMKNIADQGSETHDIHNFRKEPYIPTAKELAEAKAMKKQSKLYNKVWDHMRAEGNTMEEEYDLIVNKQSKMSRAMRDYLQAVMDYVPTAEEIKAKDERDARIAKYQEEQAKQEAASSEEEE